jgi:predicted enzyme related to lactoylglutathione lyase
MPERDGYIAGVPCWVDASEPDPGAAVGFYGGLFGWEFEDVTPPGSEGKYFGARLRGRDVAAVASTPRVGRPSRGGTPTSGSRAPTRRRPRFALPGAVSS